MPNTSLSVGGPNCLLQEYKLLLKALIIMVANRRQT